MSTVRTCISLDGDDIKLALERFIENRYPSVNPDNEQCKNVHVYVKDLDEDVVKLINPPADDLVITLEFETAVAPSRSKK